MKTFDLFLMKLLLLTLGCFGGENLNAIKRDIYPQNYVTSQQASETVNNNRLDSVCEYTWKTCWEITAIKKYNYPSTNTSEMITHSYNADSGRFIMSNKSTFSFNDKGSKTEQKDYIKKNDNWMLIWRDTLIYDAENYNILKYSDRYNQNTGEFMLRYFTEMNYENGLLKDYVRGSYQADTLYYISKNLYNYDGNNNTSAYYYSSQDGWPIWELNNYDTMQYDDRGNCIQLENFYLLDDSMILNKKLRYTYNAADQKINESQYADFANEGERPVSITYYSHNEESIPIESTSVKWFLNGWRNQSKTLMFYSNSNITFDNIDLCEGKIFSLKLTASCLTGIDNKIDEHREVLIFPNPSSGLITIRFIEEFGETGDIQVLNLEGKVIYRQKIITDNENSEYHLHLQTIPPGMYIIKVRTNGNVYQGKVMLNYNK